MLKVIEALETRRNTRMKHLQGIALLAVVGFVTMTAGIAQAGPGCCGSKATQTGAGACTGKSTSMQSGGCGSMKASGGACTGKSASACAMKTADCEKWMRTYYQTHGWAGIESDCCMGTSATPIRQLHRGIWEPNPLARVSACIEH